MSRKVRRTLVRERCLLFILVFELLSEQFLFSVSPRFSFICELHRDEGVRGFGSAGPTNVHFNFSCLLVHSVLFCTLKASVWMLSVCSTDVCTLQLDLQPLAAIYDACATLCPCKTCAAFVLVGAGKGQSSLSVESWFTSAEGTDDSVSIGFLFHVVHVHGEETNQLFLPPRRAW